jgi:hypothetical protein
MGDLQRRPVHRRGMMVPRDPNPGPMFQRCRCVTRAVASHHRESPPVDVPRCGGPVRPVARIERGCGGPGKGVNRLPAACLSDHLSKRTKSRGMEEPLQRKGVRFICTGRRLRILLPDLCRSLADILLAATVPWDWCLTGVAIARQQPCCIKARMPSSKPRCVSLCSQRAARLSLARVKCRLRNATGD